MKDNAITKITSHPDKEEILSKLILGTSPEEINIWLKDKYTDVKSNKLIISTANLKKFRDDYLDLYQTIQNDLMAIYQAKNEPEKPSDPISLINSSKEYKRMLQNYLEQEVDLKILIKELTVAAKARLEQLFIITQQNPTNFKTDYVLVQWFQQLTTLLEKSEAIINGSPDRIIQQNNINIQILDQHISVFHKVIKEVISRLDYDTSLLFVDILNEELKKLKPESSEIVPIEARLMEAKKLEDKIYSQLDTPSF